MGLFNNPKKTVIAVAAFVIVFALFLAIPKCHAAELGPFDAPYVQFGGGMAIARGKTGVLDITFTEPTTVLRNAYWQESLTLIGSSTFNNIEAPNNAVLRGLFVDGIGHFDLGLGVSWMMNPAPYNGSDFNFNLEAAYRFKKLPITITYTHLSNAGMTVHNLGRDLVLVGWRFH